MMSVLIIGEALGYPEGGGGSGLWHTKKILMREKVVAIRFSSVGQYLTRDNLRLVFIFCHIPVFSCPNTLTGLNRTPLCEFRLLWIRELYSFPCVYGSVSFAMSRLL